MKPYKYQRHPQKNNWRIVYINNIQCLDLRLLLFLEEDISPDAVFNIEATTGDGQVDMWVLVKLATVGVQGTEDADLHALFTGPP